MATFATGVAFEWGAALVMVAGLSVLSSFLANGVRIWKDTRPIPPVGEQIRQAIDHHEKHEDGARVACQTGNLREFSRLEKRVEVSERNIGSLEKSVASLDERTRGRWLPKYKSGEGEG